MKRKFRIIVGMLLLAIPLCVNAQVKIAKPGQNSKEAKEEKTDKPKDGLTMPKISGFVQGMYQANLSDKGDLLDNTLRMRRVRLSVDGNLSKTVSYKIQGDFTRSPMLVDAYVKYKPCREFAIQVGQFKTPFTLESPINPVNLEIFDYGEAVQQLVGYKDVCGVGALGRDLGLMATGSLFPVETRNGDKFGLVDYSIGVFNGNGANEKDNNNRKDFVGRLEVRPWLEDLTLTGSYYLGWFDNGNKNIHNGKRQRWSAGAQYNDGGLLIRAEYLNGLTGDPEGTLDNNGNLTEFSSEGYYAVAGYNIRFGKNDSQKMMPVFRFEHFAKDIAVVGGATDYYTIGLNYWPVKSLNLKLDFSLIQPKTGSNSHRVVGMLSYKF